MTSTAEDIRKIPMVRILVPWGTGIVMGLRNTWLAGRTGMILMLILFTVLTIGFILTRKKYNLQYIFGIASILTLFFAGWMHSSQKVTRIRNMIPEKEEGLYVAEILETAKTTNDVSTGICRITYRINDTILFPRHLRLVMYFPKKWKIDTIKPGDRFCFRGQLQPLPATRNPEEFDFGKYLLLKGISGYTRIRNEDVIRFPAGNITIRSLAFQAREYLLEILKKYKIPEKERSVMAALSLGYREDLTEDTVRAYRSAGAMHILAVSGLHVGIIYLLFQYITFFMQRKKWGRIARSLLGLCILWGYAFLTGLSPSVVRASTMFSFFTAAGLLNRKVSPFNILASAVFVILVADPFLIAQPGFQLSVAAVASIVAFYPKIAILWEPRNLFLSKIWSLIALSLSAQTGTFVLCIYYFHQFPVYFIIANLVAVPLAGLLLYGIIVLYIIAWWSFPANVLSTVLTFLTSALNQSTQIIETLPGSVISGLWITPVQMALLLIAILLIAIFLYYKKAYLLQLAIILCIGNLTIAAERKWQNSKKDLVAVYDLPNYSVISIRSGHCRIILCDSLAMKRPEYILSKTENFRIKEHAEPSVLIVPDGIWPEDTHESMFTIKLSDGCRLIALPGKNIVLSEGINIPSSQQIIKARLLIISGRKFQPPASLMTWFYPDLVVSDASVPDWCNKRYAEFFRQISIPFHPVAWMGAFVLEE